MSFVTISMSVLIEQPDFKKAQSYWTTLKSRLKQEGNESVTKCDKLKMQSADGKFYLTDVADVETLLRLIQSVPSPKAEPVKLWLAKVGYERIQEINDPEKALNRSRNYWQRMGRSQQWIYPIRYIAKKISGEKIKLLSNGVKQRMMGQEIRNKLTDYWKNNEVKEQDEYAILTNIIHEEWSELSVKEHKNLKNLKTENLRDHIHPVRYLFKNICIMFMFCRAQKIKNFMWAIQKI